MIDYDDFDENGDGVEYVRVRLSELDAAGHRELAHSLYQTETFLRAAYVPDPQDKRARTLAVRLLRTLRGAMAELYSDAYADPIREDDIAVDLDVWTMFRDDD